MSRTSRDQGHHELGHILEQGRLGEKDEAGLFSHIELWCVSWLLPWFAMQHGGLQRHAQA